MKKLFSLLLVLFLLTGSACASTQFYKYNALAKMYGAPLLTEEMLMDETEGKIAYDSGDLCFIFIPDSNSAIVYGADSADFLPACVCATFTLGYEKNAVDFLGNLLYSYMTVKSGKELSYGYYGSMYFTISSKEDFLLFAIGEP